MSKHKQPLQFLVKFGLTFDKQLIKYLLGRSVSEFNCTANHVVWVGHQWKKPHFMHCQPVKCRQWQASTAACQSRRPNLVGLSILYTVHGFHLLILSCVCMWWTSESHRSTSPWPQSVKMEGANEFENGAAAALLDDNNNNNTFNVLLTITMLLFVNICKSLNNLYSSID